MDISLCLDPKKRAGKKEIGNKLVFRSKENSRKEKDKK